MSEATENTRQFLGQYGVVAKLIENFAMDIMAIFDNKIRTGDESAQAAVVDKCREMAAIFKGENSGYEVAPWRSEGRLEGKIVGWHPGKIKGGDDALLEFFKIIAARILNNCRALHEGMAEEEAGPRLRETLKDAVEKLVGVQP